jgi:hypothetical protein
MLKRHINLALWFDAMGLSDSLQHRLACTGSATHLLCRITEIRVPKDYANKPLHQRCQQQLPGFFIQPHVRLTWGSM